MISGCSLLLLHRPLHRGRGGTSEVMSLIIQHEYYRELGVDHRGRDVEADAAEADLAEEKVYE